MTSPPAWFSAALATEPEERAVTCEGTSIAYRAWGDPADRNIVLIHGGAAHSRWWDHIAPLLARGWRVVAMDLSGHGDSGRREHYSLDIWAREVLAVVTDAGRPASTVVIGHSMGGLVTLRLATLAGAVRCEMACARCHFSALIIPERYNRNGITGTFACRHFLQNRTKNLISRPVPPGSTTSRGTPSRRSPAS